VRIGNSLRRQLDRLLQLYPRLRWGLVLVLVVLAALFGRPLERMAPGPLGPGEFGELSGYVTVIDGDSLRLGGSEVPRRQLQRLIGRQKVSCRSVERDKHGRYLGTCEAGGKTLNSAMVESGWAVSYGNYGAEERAAKAARRGIWSGTFQMPREWRRERGIGR
jgi:hypothetical protein